MNANLKEKKIKLTPIYLSDIDVADRESKRPINLRQENFDELFESKIIFYDVFIANKKLIFIGPTSDAVVIDYAVNRIKINGNPIKNSNPKVYFTNKVLKIIIDLQEDIIEITTNKSILLPDTRPTFLNSKKVAYTIQKNNNLFWIKDWISINRQIHNINHFVIYDNGSTNYTHEYLYNFLKSDENIHITVVSIPYLYGPGAYLDSDWDSDFLQYAMFEHMRYSFFQDAGLLLNIDIDEIVPSQELFNFFKQSNAGAIFFKGFWTYVPRGFKQQINFDSIRHSHHSLIDTSVQTPRKWVANLAKLSDDVFLQVHNIVDSKGIIKNFIGNKFYYCHFSGLTNGWKVNRKPFYKHEDESNLEGVLFNT